MQNLYVVLLPVVTYVGFFGGVGVAVLADQTRYWLFPVAVPLGGGTGYALSGTLRLRRTGAASPHGTRRSGELRQALVVTAVSSAGLILAGLLEKDQTGSNMVLLGLAGLVTVGLTAARFWRDD